MCCGSAGRGALELTLNCIVIGGAAAIPTHGPGTLTLDTPVERIAGNPAGKLVLDANLPQVLRHPDYEAFKSISLRQLLPLSQEQLTEQALAAAETQLATVMCDATPPDSYNPEAFRKAFGIGPAGASLIRPDGYVAWRSIEFPLDTTSELAGALHQVSFATSPLHPEPTTDVVEP